MLPPPKRPLPVMDAAHLYDDDTLFEGARRKRGRKRRTCHSCDQTKTRCDHCVCGINGMRSCANPTNHPPGQCRTVKREANGQLVWGERTVRLMGTSRVTAMCDNCQKITKTEEEEAAAAAMARMKAEAARKPGGAVTAAVPSQARVIPGGGRVAPALPPAAPPWSGTGHDALLSMAVHAALADVATGLGDPRAHAILAARLGALPGAPAPPAASRHVNTRLGLPMGKSTWSPLLRLVHGKPVTEAQYAAYIQVRMRAAEGGVALPAAAQMVQATAMSDVPLEPGREAVGLEDEVDTPPLPPESECAPPSTLTAAPPSSGSEEEEYDSDE